MSKPNPYKISISEGGRFVRYEWEAHYLTDEQLETVRRHVETLQAENSKLRDELDLCLKNVQKCEECEAMFNCEDCEAMLDCDECLRADSSQKERKRVDYENAKLRELVRDMQHAIGCLVVLGDAYVERHEDELCALDDRMRELGVEV